MSRRPRLSAVAGAGLAVATLVAACSSADDDNWEARFWWGAHVAQAGGESRRQAIERFEDGFSTTMNGARVYRRWEDEFPDEDHRWLADEQRLIVLSIKPIRSDESRIPWAEIAAAVPGSPIDDELRNWAKKIRAIDRPIYVSLHHEPETVDDRASGTSADYVAAWRRFAEIIRSDAGTKTRLIWIMTDASFGQDSASWQRADLWYPGDDAVDAIGVDAFNWFTCRGRDEPWLSLETLVEPARIFAAAHPDKALWITEFGTVGDSSLPTRRDLWMSEASSLPRQPGWGQLRGLLYFEDVHGHEYPNCDWRIGTHPNPLAAFQELSAMPSIITTLQERPLPAD